MNEIVAELRSLQKDMRDFCCPNGKYSWQDIPAEKIEIFRWINELGFWIRQLETFSNEEN
ncbi:MAG: hypothetical protein A2W19_01405 [Spirochaetes bacterium RBG_16_49_21]|nr:MAG: hypothetical protein A2W19_01405 [Spirochaetes bacterium RBG_16_49_21]